MRVFAIAVTTNMVGMATRRIMGQLAVLFRLLLLLLLLFVLPP